MDEKDPAMDEFISSFRAANPALKDVSPAIDAGMGSVEV
jgi:hypothetical protein